MSQQTHAVHDNPSERRPVNDELLTISEVAAIVRVPVATLRYWRHLGTGPRSFRVGRGVRYWNHDVNDWLENLSNDPQTSPELRGDSGREGR